MVLDTANVALYALDGCKKNPEWGDFSFWVSSSPEEHMPKVKKMFGEALPDASIQYLVDKGKTFDEHFNSCYRQLFEMGYQNVICIGGDLPGITPDLIYRAFSNLIGMGNDSDEGAMVIAPCQAGGVSLVGITRDSGIDFTGAFYNADGVTTLDAIVSIASYKNVPMALFEALSDVDYGEDLGHMITIINAMAYASQFQKDILVPERTLSWIEKIGLCANAPPNKSSDPRTLIDA
jgi:2-phospho-L-lactate guanylyltransferase (CobY/MobA/RfbA family)